LTSLAFSAIARSYSGRPFSFRRSEAPVALPWLPSVRCPFRVTFFLSPLATRWFGPPILRFRGGLRSPALWSPSAVDHDVFTRPLVFPCSCFRCAESTLYIRAYNYLCRNPLSPRSFPSPSTLVFLEWRLVRHVFPFLGEFVFWPLFRLLVFSFIADRSISFLAFPPPADKPHTRLLLIAATFFSSVYQLTSHPFFPRSP